METVQKIIYNRSTYFLLPLLDIPFHLLNNGEKETFKNTYLAFERDTTATSEPIEYDNIYIVVKPEANEALIDFAIQRKDFLGNQEISYRKEVVFKFRLSNEVIDIKHLLLMGKYSKLPDDAKTKIVKYLNPKIKQGKKKVENPNYRALFPNEESRRALEIILDAKLPQDAEILSPLDRDRETYKA